MARPKKVVPSLRRHRYKGRPDQAFIQVDGKRVYLGRWGTKEAGEVYARFIAEYAANDGRIPISGGCHRDGPVMVELTVAYLKYAKKYYRKNGEETQMVKHVEAALRVVKKLYGSILVADFGVVQLKAVREAMVERGWARFTVNYRVAIVRRAFRWGVTECLVPESVYRTLKCLPDLKKGRSMAPESVPVRPVEDSVVEATLPFCPPTVAAMLRIQRLCGCRPGEIVIMRPCDIDTSGDVWLYRPESHKTEHHGKSRVVCLGPKSQSILFPYLDRDPEEYCFSPTESEQLRRIDENRRRKTPLSCGNRRGTNRVKAPKRKAGSRYSVKSFCRAVHRSCVAAGVELWSPNRLRHTMATEARKRFGLEDVRTVLGHSSAVTTELYAERDVATASRIARELG